MVIEPIADSPISESLEDYLETIHDLVRDKKVARVKDIARTRNVSMASVSTAMRRLADLGLVDYTQREFIAMTEKGEGVVRRIVARHQLLRRFLTAFLQVDAEIADKDACQIEHHVSDQTVDRLVRLLEFLETCPDGRQALEAFQGCREVNPEFGDCDELCLRRAQRVRELVTRPLRDLQPGERGLIAKIKAVGALRQRLIDMGLLPHTEVAVERVAPTGDPMWIRIRGFNLSLRKDEAQGILVTPV
jgi:DtxR family Mn-dependent transcriptional regulator